MHLDDTRTCGILLHPTSLPGPYGIGTLGAQARAFVDFLHDAGQSLWQVLPLGPTGYGDSPYAALSTFAGNPLLIDLDLLAQEGLLTASELEHAPASTHAVDYGATITFKMPLLRAAAQRFAKTAIAERRAAFDQFCDEHRWWLEEYALFYALKRTQGGKPIDQWPSELKRREPSALQRARLELADDLHACRFMQFAFFDQWQSLRRYAHSKDVFIMGDMPIFVAYDSAAVWVYPHLFKIDSDLKPYVVAGVPPDYFSATGQLWGNPLYDWKRHEQEGFRWWLERVRHALALADIIRLDHFRGFQAAWEVPAGQPTAEHGTWVEGPANALFNAMRERFGGLPLVAEDLGLITEDVIALRDRFGLPGMIVLQFGFNPQEERRQHAPHNAIRNSVVYTGTHDNDTTQGWFDHLESGERTLVETYLNSSGTNIPWAMIRAAYATAANTAIVPMQDVLALGSQARMNMPGQPGSWWTWRMTAMPNEALTARLRELAWAYERLANGQAPSRLAP